MKLTKLLFCFLLLSGMGQELMALTLHPDDSNTTNKSIIDVKTSTAFADLTSMTISDDGTNLEILIEGTGIAADYDVFIDIDNNPATGYNDGGSVLGADFYMDEFNIYSYSGVTPGWGWTGITGKTNEVVAGVSHKFTITRAALGLTSAGTVINVRFLNNGTVIEALPASGMQAYTTTVAETVAASDLTSMTLSDDGTNLEILIEGTGIAADYDAFIDIDNNTATGLAGSGADFYIDEFNLYSYSGAGGAWGWTVIAGRTNTVVAGVSHKFTITKGALGLSSAGTVINVSFQNNGGTTETLPASGLQAYTTTTASNLASLTLTDDVNLILTVLGANIEATYDVFIDTDNNAATGYAVGGIGADFLIQNGAFYSNNGGGFNWTQIVTGLSVTDATGSRKLVVDRTALSLTASGTAIKAMYQNTVAFTPTDVLSAVSYTTTSAVTSTAWTGATSSVWNLAGNWDNGIPTTSSIVTIPVAGAAPEIAAGTEAKVGSLSITHGFTINANATLIVSGTATGNVTYKRPLTAANWYLVSSPVSGEDMTDMRANNVFATNVGSEIAFAVYDNSQVAAIDRWSYYDTAATVPLTNGKGYSTQLTSGDISFTGALNTSDVAISLTQGVNNFNLLGNPYAAFINSGTFLTSNTGELVQEEIYLWNNGAYETKVSGISFKVAPGQGFFVEANSTNNVTFKADMQSHESSDTFLKSSNTEIKLNISDGVDSRFAEIYYLENASTDFDNGYDGKLFGGVSHPFAIYTHLISNSQGKSFQIQSLPNSGYENMIIPIGVNAEAGKEINITASVLNMPTGIKVYLEDRVTNTFTRLDEVNSSYKITLANTLNGIGRFYLHTTNSSLSVDNNELALENVSIYKTDNYTLRITGLSQGKSDFRLFNILGKQIMNTSFTSNGIKDVSLPKIETGVYIIQLETEGGTLNKKIILE